MANQQGNGLSIQIWILIITLVAHTGVLFYWGGKTSTTLDTLRENQKSLQITMQNLDDRLRIIESRSQR